MFVLDVRDVHTYNINIINKLGASVRVVIPVLRTDSPSFAACPRTRRAVMQVHGQRCARCFRPDRTVPSPLKECVCDLHLCAQLQCFFYQ